MPALPTCGVEIDTSKENGVSSLLDKDWNWKWDYGELYEVTGCNVGGQRATSGLSTESLFYFMEFYNQDRSSDGALCDVLAFTFSMALRTFSQCLNCSSLKQVRLKYLERFTNFILFY